MLKKQKKLAHTQTEMIACTASAAKCFLQKNTVLIRKD